MDKLISFLNWLEEQQIHYRLSKIRESILVEVAVPGQRWEIEFFEDGEILIEKFQSTAQLQSLTELDALLQELSAYIN